MSSNNICVGSEDALMKICTDCKTTKPLSEFYKNSKWYRGRCKICHNLKFQPRTGKPNTGRFKKGHKPVAPFQKGNVPWTKGKHLSKEIIEKISLKNRVHGKSRSSWNYEQWRKSVFERDNYTCQECLSKKNLNAHHIKSKKEFPDLIFEINNGKTLCRRCHARLHGIEMCNIIKRKSAEHWVGNITVA